jgi:hypothetical protein
MEMGIRSHLRTGRLARPLGAIGRAALATMAVVALTGGLAGTAAAQYGVVTSGMSRDLDRYRPPGSVAAPPGYTVCDIMGIGIAGSNDHVYAWYRDGTVSSGSTRELERYRENRPYALPPGLTPEDIIAVAITGSNDWVYAWYRNGTMSAGTSVDLGSRIAPRPFALPPGKDPLSVVGIGIAGSNDRVFVWYDDGTVSSGTSQQFAAYTPPQPYTGAPGRTPDRIIDLAIAGSNDHVYTWYGDCPTPRAQTLNVDLIAQETNSWCWAASGQMLMSYIGNVNVPQCVQANDRLGYTNCCQTPVPAACIEPNWPDMPRYGFSQRTGGALSWDAVRRQLANGGPFRGRPFGFSWGWLVPDATGTLQPTDAGHMMVAVGYFDGPSGRWVEVHDPWPPNLGDHRFDFYDFYVADPASHVHWTDFFDIRYTGGR